MKYQTHNDVDLKSVHVKKEPVYKTRVQLQQCWIRRYKISINGRVAIYLTEGSSKITRLKLVLFQRETQLLS